MNITVINYIQQNCIQYFSHMVNSTGSWN